MSYQDELYEQMLWWLKNKDRGQFATAVIQRKFLIGYNRAHRLLELALEAKAIEPAESGQYRIAAASPPKPAHKSRLIDLLVPADSPLDHWIEFRRHHAEALAAKTSLERRYHAQKLVDLLNLEVAS